MSQLQDAKKIIQILNEKGFVAYIVGGYVRDFLLHKLSEDIDIATNALPSEVNALFPKTLLTGLKHGTVTVIYQNHQYEITTFRTEDTYILNRKPEQVTFVSSLEEDVKRRDFTMNALALTIDDQVIDYVGGRNDIENKTIRAVGNPYERFKEDALRMLRAFRFVSQIGFSIDQEALAAIKQNAHLIENISYERIISEFEHMISGNYFLEAIEILVSTSIHTHLISFKKGLEKIIETNFIPKDLFELLTICAVSSSYDEIKKLPISNQIKKEVRIVCDMFELDIKEFTKPLIFRNGLSNCLLANQLNVSIKKTIDKKETIIESYQTMPIHKQCDLKFKGDDIIQLYDKLPGAWISDILEDICLKVLLGQLENDYQIIKSYLVNKDKK